MMVFIIHDVNMSRKGYYCVAGGASSFHSIAHMREAIQEKGFRAKLCDVTHELGILSIQGLNYLHSKIINRPIKFHIQ